MHRGLRRPWLIMVVLGTLIAAACSEDPSDSSDTAVAEESAQTDEQSQQPDDEGDGASEQPGPSAEDESGEEDVDEPSEEQPDAGSECGFLECGDGVPAGVDGIIETIIPGPPCFGADLEVLPVDAVQGEQLVICMPEAVSRLAPYTVTITGPVGVVVSAERDTPEGIPPIFLDLSPGVFPTGGYSVNVVQDQPSVRVDDSLGFTIDLATTPHVLVEDAGPGSIRVWVTGGGSDSTVVVDFYQLVPDEGCVYRGSESIGTDGNGVGSADFRSDALAPGQYFAFQRSEGFRTCNAAAGAFRVS